METGFEYSDHATKSYVKDMSTKTEVILEEWDWFLKDVNDDHKRAVTGIVLENTARHLEMLEESTTSSNIFGISNVLLPVIRRIYPNLTAQSLISVQPMLTPISLLFYLRFFTGNDKSNTRLGQEFLQVPAVGELGEEMYYSSQTCKVTVSDDTTYGQTTSFGGDASGGITIAPGIYTPVLNASVFIVAKYKGQPVAELQATGVYSGATNPLVLVRGDSGIFTAANFDNSSGSEEITFTTAYDQEGGSTPAAGNQQPFDAVEVFWDYDLEIAGTNIPEMELRIVTDPIVAKERKSKVKWTIESAEDLKAYHGLDAERELVNLMSSKIMMEIDREIIDDLLRVAAHRSRFNYTDDGNNNTTGNFLDRAQALASFLSVMSNNIHRVTKVGPANWIVTSPVIAGRLRELRGYNAASPDKDGNGSYGVNYSGQMGSGIKVFTDPYMRQDTILMGHKGNSYLDSGYFHCPFIPVKVTPDIYDPETLQPVKGMTTRYGKKVIDGGEYFYGVCVVNGFDSN